MSQIRQDNFENRHPKSLDDRLVKADLASRDAIPEQYRYIGMEVYVESEEKYFSLIGGLNNSFWQERTGGGSGGGTRRVIKDNEYNNNSPVLVTRPDRDNVIFDIAFVTEDDSGGNNTIVKDTLYAGQVEGSIGTTATVGNIPSGTPAAELNGKTLTELLTQIFFEEIFPSYTLSTLSTSRSPNTTNFERGSSVGVNFTSTFSQRDYGQGSNYRLIRDGSTTVDSQAGPFTGNNIPVGLQPYTLIENISSNKGAAFTFQSFIDYADAPAQDSNFGNPDPSPPTGGTLQTSLVTYFAREPYWVDSYTTAEIPDAGGGIPNIGQDNAQVRSASIKELDTGSSEVFTVTPANGDNWVIVACPPGTGVTSAQDQFGTPFGSLVTNFIPVNFTDSELNAGTEVTYNVHYYFSPAGFTGASILTITAG